MEYDVFPGETVGIVGESGSGKSVSVMSLLGLIHSRPGGSGRKRHVQGARPDQDEEEGARELRGGPVAMIFQDPMTSLNPVLADRPANYVKLAIRTHNPRVKESVARQRVIELLKIVGVPNPAQRYSQYPHEFSGGMRQRAMIAMAMANQPSLLIADEPTTALDVTIQAQIIEASKAAQRETPRRS